MLTERWPVWAMMLRSEAPAHRRCREYRAGADDRAGNSDNLCCMIETLFASLCTALLKDVVKDGLRAVFFELVTEANLALDPKNQWREPFKSAIITWKRRRTRRTAKHDIRITSRTLGSAL